MRRRTFLAATAALGPVVSTLTAAVPSKYIYPFDGLLVGEHLAPDWSWRRRCDAIPRQVDAWLAAEQRKQLLRDNAILP